MLKSLFKLSVIYFLRIVMMVLHIFPVKNNRIIFNAYSGRQYACNPKYIAVYLNTVYPGKYELIWAIRKASNHKEILDDGMKVVEYFSLKRLYYEATAKVSINNIGSFSWMTRTSYQMRINTWHGGGCYKKVGLGEKRNDKIMKKTIAMSANNTSYMLASSKYNADIVWPNDLGYHGEVLRTGFPRNDVLINGNAKMIKKKVCENLDIPLTKKIILFAPTWRYQNRGDTVLPDFEIIKEACNIRFGGEWVVLVRTHGLVKNGIGDGKYIDATRYLDMQELLVAADILISDYSSCIWDYSLQMTKPCILFTQDLKKYEEERGFDVDIQKWGFPVCTNDYEIREAIISFEPNKFEKAMKKHHDDLGSYDDGKACSRVGNLIEKFCFGVEPE